MKTYFAVIKEIEKYLGSLGPNETFTSESVANQLQIYFPYADKQNLKKRISSIFTKMQDDQEIKVVSKEGKPYCRHNIYCRVSEVKDLVEYWDEVIKEMSIKRKVNYRDALMNLAHINSKAYNIMLRNISKQTGLKAGYLRKVGGNVIVEVISDYIQSNQMEKHGELGHNAKHSGFFNQPHEAPRIPSNILEKAVEESQENFMKKSQEKFTPELFVSELSKYINKIVMENENLKKENSLIEAQCHEMRKNIDDLELELKKRQFDIAELKKRTEMDVRELLSPRH
jgi:hypothetical protein